MRNFLFEQYGYYPKELENNEFYLENFIFKLVETNLNEENIQEIENHTNIIKEGFNGLGPFIIRNKNNKCVSNLLEKKYLLISTYYMNMNLNDLIRLHKLFYQHDEYMELEKILQVWEERVEKIEKNLNQYLRIDSVNYASNLTKSTFVVGLAINAMQYLSDLINDYNNKLYGITITHKRLKDLNSYDFFNPLNFIVDNPCRDLAMLYQNDAIDVNELENMIRVYEPDPKSVSFLLARLLYRCDVFDYLERKKDIGSDDHVMFDIEKELNKIKKAYSLFKNKFDIRPIEWLEG